MVLSHATEPSGASGVSPRSNGDTDHAADGAPPGYTGSIRCAQCQTVASVSRKFCGSCGKPLWRPCHQCGTLSAAEEKFCGACGADLFAGAQQHLARFEDDLQQAERLRRQCCFDEALALVGPIAKATQPEFSGHAARAAQKVSQCLADRETWRARVEAIETEASANLERLDFAAALRQLESVPTPMRDEAVTGLLEEARSRLDEIKVLSTEIEGVSGSSLSPDLLAKVGRLLALKPDHAAGRQLAARFCQRLCQVAEAKLAGCRYEEVVQVLDRIPEALRTDAVRAVRDKASQLASLAWDLRHAPVVDAPLVRLALHFRQVAPHDQQMAPLCFQILDRAKSIATDPSSALVPWNTAPEPGPLGCPVVWESAPEHIGLDADLDPAVLRANPGSFAVACGLALQGLQRAAISVNLRSDETPLWMRIAQWGPKRRPHAAWGIDLGSGSLKAVKLVLDRHQPGGVAIQACDLVEHKKILSQAGNDERKSLIEETLQSFMARNNTRGDRVCVGLPAEMLFLHWMKMPPMEPAKLDAAVEFEARTAFPVPLDALAWQYVVLNQDSQGKGDRSNLPERSEGCFAQIGPVPFSRPPEMLDIALLGVRSVLLTERLARFESAGLRVDEVQSDCLALHNYVVHNYFQPGEDAAGGEASSTGVGKGDRSNLPERPEGCSAQIGPVPFSRDERTLAILDIGADATNFIVSSPRSVWLRSVGMGVDRVNKTLVREFRITFAQAEQWKRDPASASNVGRVLETLQAVYEDFFQEAAASLKAFTRVHKGRKVERILGLGGGFHVHGLLRYLRLRR